MAGKNKQTVPKGSRKGDHALQRVLRLPVVSSACNSLQKTYNATKESHPLVASLCEAYERGIQAAGSLAMWSVKPVVQKLEPQFAAADVLACHGLDLLEQRIPALHKPVEEVTSELKDSIYTHVKSAMRSVADALDQILGLAAESYEQAQNTVRDVAEDARSSQASHLAEAGVEAAIGKVEKLVDALLPNPEHGTAHESSGVDATREGPPSSIFGRIGALARHVSQHAYRQTTQAIQQSRDKGQGWALWIPGLETASDWLSKSQSKPPEKERNNGEDQTSMSGTNTKALSTLTENLQAACLSTISAMKEDNATPCDAAGQRPHSSPRRAVSEASTKMGTLRRILQTLTSSFLGTVFHYVPIPKLLVKEEGTSAETAEGSETTQQQEISQPPATQTSERGPPEQLRGDWRSNRGHFPLSFLNLDEPQQVQQASFQRRSPAFEADHTSTRKSAFSPYREAAGSRRLSEGLYRSSSESAYVKAHYTGLYGTVLKKD